MAKVMFGNHSSVIVPRQDRDSIRVFVDFIVMSPVGKSPKSQITKGKNERDFLRLAENFYIGFAL